MVLFFWFILKCFWMLVTDAPSPNVIQEAHAAYDARNNPRHWRANRNVCNH
jgi:hypothetical protein